VSKPKIGDLFLYLIRLLANDDNWYVALRGRTEVEVRNEFYTALTKHTNILINKLNVNTSGDLDSHKQAAAICLAVLDVYPLCNLSEPVEKKREFYFPNEFIAMKMSRYHVRSSMPNVDSTKPDTFISSYKYALIHDKHPYDNNFMYMLWEEKQLLLEGKGNNYFMLSKLFYHFENDIQ